MHADQTPSSVSTSANGKQWDFSSQSTLPRLMSLNATHYPNMVAIREKDLGIWQETSWSQWLHKTLCFAAALESLGFQAGSELLVIGDNRANLYTGIVACGMLRGLAMPVFPDATPAEVKHVLQRSDRPFVLAEDQEQVDKILELVEDGVQVGQVVYDDPRGLADYVIPYLWSWSSLQEKGAALLSANPALAQTLIERAQPEDTAVCIHSSGTTGKPKAVVLSHRNVLSGVHNAYRAKSFGFGETVLAYLPMAWIGDFAITLGAGIALRFYIHVPESGETTLNDLREVAPTYYLAAPRSWDNMLTRVQVRMEDSTPLKKRVYQRCMQWAIEMERQALKGLSPSALQQFKRWLADWLVCRPIKDQLGLSRVEHAFTGGEAIGEDTFIFYRALGVKLRQLYGQTETSAFNAMQDVNEVKLHTVGRPLPGVTVRIDDSGEILIQSDSVFESYLQQPDATQASKVEGWLRTGDAGYMEPDGHLVVLGRLSEVVYTQAGERYIPNYIENRLKFSPYVKDVAVLGAGRDTLAAMICIDMEAVGHWAELRGIAYMSYADLSQKPDVLKLLEEAVQKVNRDLPEPLRLRQFVSLHKEFDADDGEVTRTRKLKRNVIEDRYSPVIEAIYANQDTVVMKAKVVYETGDEGIMERELRIRRVI